MKRRILCLSMVLIMALLSACGGGTADGGAAPAGGSSGDAGPAAPSTLRVARGEDVTTWDPYNNTGIQLIMISKLIYNNLVQMTADGQLVPDLATEWSGNDDATEWTFQLRDDVKFSDGTPFNAEAVKTSLERYLNETLSNGNQWTTFLGVDVTGEYTCVLKFSDSNGSLPNTLCETPMLNPTIVQEGAEGLDKAIGTGPYQLDSWEIGNKVVLKKNENFWGEPPVYDTIEFYVIQEDSTRLAAVQTGDIDIADQIPADLALTVENDPSVQLERVNGQDNMFLGLKCDAAPFDDVNARLAVLYGINRQSLVDNVVLGGQTVRSILPEGTLGYNASSFEEIPYDPEYARELLSKTNYNGEPLEFIAPIGWYAKQSEQCQAIIADLQAIGFQINLTMLEGATFSTTRNNGEYHIYTTGCAHASNDPNQFFSQRVKGDSAKSGYVNPELNAAIDAGAASKLTEERQAQYEKAARIMLENAAPMIPLFQWERIYAVSSKIDLAASANAFRSDLRMDLRYVVFA